MIGAVLGTTGLIKHTVILLEMRGDRDGTL
jgi:hypothetical protein